MSDQKPAVVVYAFEHIKEVEIRDKFLGIIAVWMIGGDWVSLCQKWDVSDGHPVWPFIEDFIKQEYTKMIEETLTKMKKQLSQAIH